MPTFQRKSLDMKKKTDLVTDSRKKHLAANRNLVGAGKHGLHLIKTLKQLL